MKATASARSTVQPVRSSAAEDVGGRRQLGVRALVRVREAFVAEHQEGAARADGLGGRLQHAVAVEGHGGLQVAGHHEVPAPGGEVGLQIAAAPGDPVRDARIARGLGPDRQRGRRRCRQRSPSSRAPRTRRRRHRSRCPDPARCRGRGGGRPARRPAGRSADHSTDGDRGRRTLPRRPPDRWTRRLVGGAVCWWVWWSWVWWLVVGLVLGHGSPRYGRRVSIIGRTGRDRHDPVAEMANAPLAGGARRKPSVVGKRAPGVGGDGRKPSVVGKRTRRGRPGSGRKPSVVGKRTPGVPPGTRADAVRGRKTYAPGGVRASGGSRPWSGNARPGRYQAVTWCARIG